MKTPTLQNRKVKVVHEEDGTIHVWFGVKFRKADINPLFLDDLIRSFKMEELRELIDVRSFNLERFFDAWNEMPSSEYESVIHHDFKVGTQIGSQHWQIMRRSGNKGSSKCNLYWNDNVTDEGVIEGEGDFEFVLLYTGKPLKS